MLLTSKTRRLNIYKASKQQLSQRTMDVKLIKVEKGELLTVDNLHSKLQEGFNYLKQAKFIDVDQKPQLPVHVVLQWKWRICADKNSNEFVRTDC